jgi:hypothetical protein
VLLKGLYWGNALRKPWSICQVAMAAVSVVLAVWLLFKELNVPFRNVSAGWEFGTFWLGVYKSRVRRSKEPLVGVSYEKPT